MNAKTLATKIVRAVDSTVAVPSAALRELHARVEAIIAPHIAASSPVAPKPKARKAKPVVVHKLCRPPADAREVERWTGSAWIADDGAPGLAFSGQATGARGEGVSDWACASGGDGYGAGEVK